ncbi:30S ribosome-binding factor RbfA [Desulfoplanes formicivorans]|uniref:Ribosome-binding factor A n=1 Tax=Desulfoplanes formicivorans TaxID=1592317 RepID=A0A194AHQ3_9BACT|nr:30S ribosome-binding factor RbfA [Desulfoplanes formicivorans]GAU09612.1 ribosome-binding factor A [Desulfoplanes formicivorans]
MQRTTSRRGTRMADQLMRELSRIMVEESQDPRLELVSITGVRLNRDFSIAEVMYTHIKGKGSIPELEKGFAQAAGFLRSRLGQRLRMRRVPELRFTWDDFLEEMVYDHIDGQDS